VSDPLLSLIALTLVPQIGPVQARILLQHFEPEEIFRARRNQLQSIEGIGPERASAILGFRNFSRAESELRFIEKRKIKAIQISDPNYPKRLLHCYDPPVLLYLAGEADLNEQQMLAIIGTRQPTENGRMWTERIVEELSGNNITILSGLAMGVDAIAHRTALKHQLKTIGVLAHGLDRIYPSQHGKLAAEIERTGGLLTEFVHGTEPDRYHFPARNRIVAGMADATLVIESGEKGGSLITASLANQYNRDVFALPGRMQDEKSRGCLKLIRQHQSELFISTQDMLTHLGWGEQPAPRKQATLSLFPELTETEDKIVTLLKQDEALHQDQIGWKLNLSAAQLSSCLLQLEMKGVVVSLPGKKFQARL
jgi:DNA processing protein